MKVRNAINTSVVAVSPSTSISKAAEQMDSHDVGVLAVIANDGETVGIVTDRELATEVSVANPMTTPVEAVVPPVITGCYADVEFEEALQVMLLMRMRHLPVFDRGNHLIGFVSAQPPRRQIH